MDKYEVFGWLNILYSGIGEAVPQLLVSVFGLIFSLKKYKVSLKTGRLALLGLGIMFLVGMANFVIGVVRLQTPDWVFYTQATEILFTDGIVSTILNFIWTISLAVLILAIWADRNKKED